MGYYIQGPTLGKAKFIIENYGAERISEPDSFTDISSDKALICVVSNYVFEAAGFCHNQREFDEFTYEGDARAKEWLIMDIDKAKELTNFPG